MERNKLNNGLGRTYLIFLVAGMTPWPADASPQTRGHTLPVDEMVRQADVIGVATVQGEAARLETRTGMVCTDFRLNFSEVWKGDPGREFILVKPGGKLPDQRVTVPGHEFRLKTGEPVVVFAGASKLGNHVVIGLRQGLYRVGPGSDRPLYRVSEHPLAAGTSSPLSLQSLKDEVWRALGRPVEPSTTPAPPKESSSTAPPAAPAAPPAPPIPASNPVTAPSRPDLRLWGGLIVLMLLIALGSAVVLSKRKKGLKP